MSTIIAQPGGQAHSDPDAAARKRRDRLARATAEEMESALAFLRIIDPEAFEIAFTAATPADGEIPEDEEPFPVCRECGAPVGIFLAHGLRWQHFRGDGITWAPRRSTTPATLRRSPGFFPMRFRTISSQQPCSVPPPAIPAGALRRLKDATAVEDRA